MSDLKTLKLKEESIIPFLAKHALLDKDIDQRSIGVCVLIPIKSDTSRKRCEISETIGGELSTTLKLPDNFLIKKSDELPIDIRIIVTLNEATNKSNQKVETSMMYQVAEFDSLHNQVIKLSGTVTAKE